MKKDSYEIGHQMADEIMRSFDSRMRDKFVRKASKAYQAKFTMETQMKMHLIEVVRDGHQIDERDNG